MLSQQPSVRIILSIVSNTISTHQILQVCGMTGRSYTYGMAYGMSRKFGSALVRGGAVKGDVLGLVLPNIPEFPIGKNLEVDLTSVTWDVPERIERFIQGCRSGSAWIRINLSKVKVKNFHVLKC